MKKSYLAHIEVSGCVVCGMCELVDFECLSRRGAAIGPSSKKEAWIQELKSAIHWRPGRKKKMAYVIWFRKPGNSRRYEHEVFRQIVKKWPGVVALGSQINPNTGNRLDGYLIRS